MESVIKELWYGNVCPQSDIWNNSLELKNTWTNYGGINDKTRIS